jgi:hypothetical protein
MTEALQMIHDYYNGSPGEGDEDDAVTYADEVVRLEVQVKRLEEELANERARLAQANERLRSEYARGYRQGVTVATPRTAP